MAPNSLPWSFYSILLTFGVFFFSLNVWILGRLLSHPMSSDVWLVGILLGGIGTLCSIRMVRVHQAELVAAKRAREQAELMTEKGNHGQAD
ncbi:MAG: hypothetical protein HXY34_06230 [Candidatus Thorarchaeota archaeon]|nr:hypothetical protein [Candidatus Thorarchaeota archaeon]